MRMEAESPERYCPVVINSVELIYNHQGGVSRPQLSVEFENHSGKKISNVRFSLSLLDAGGYRRPYPYDLAYKEGLNSGKKKVFIWDLAPESVDIHRTGEAVVVKIVEFDDTTHWFDDDSEFCVFTVDFHAK